MGHDKDLDLPLPDQGDAFLCAKRAPIPISWVFTCHLGQPKIWDGYPASKQRELMAVSCKTPRHIINCFQKFSRADSLLQEKLLPWKRISKYICRMILVYYLRFSRKYFFQEHDQFPEPETTSELEYSHIHLFPHQDKTVHPLELALVWIVSLLVIMVLVMVSRNIWKHFYNSPHLARLQDSCDGDCYGSTIDSDGIIVPSIRHYEPDEARNIIRRKKRSASAGPIGEYQMKRVSNRVASDCQRIMELEMELSSITDDPEESQILSETEDNILEEDELVLDEILSLTIDSMLQALTTESQEPRSKMLESPAISLPSPLSPAYIPVRPVFSIWSHQHTSDRLYRYTYIERIVYPHQRLIVPPALLL